jgi:hypothetical protein
VPRITTAQPTRFPPEKALSLERHAESQSGFQVSQAAVSLHVVILLIRGQMLLADLD